MVHKLQVDENRSVEKGEIIGEITTKLLEIKLISYISSQQSLDKSIEGKI